MQFKSSHYSLNISFFLSGTYMFSFNVDSRLLLNSTSDILFSMIFAFEFRILSLGELRTL